MTSLLHGRLTCLELLSKDTLSETWIGSDENGCDCLIRVWPFHLDQPDTAVRALWSREERRLRRLASVSGSEDSLLTYCDGGLDKENGAFVMALSTTGGNFTPLAGQLQRRTGELAFPSLRKSAQRAPIWEAVALIARGIHLMHRQRILHQSIGAETVFTAPDLGSSSWRLGGFDWAFRFGTEKPGNVETPRWAGRPATLQDGISFAADWYQFGTLIARIFCNVESIGGMGADERHAILLREVESGAQAQLTGREKTLILRLLGFRASDRLISGVQLIDEIQDIAKGLAAGTLEVDTDVPLVLVFNPDHLRLTDACKDKGFYPTADKLEPYRSRDVGHVAALRDFLQADLREATLHRLGDGKSAVLCGTELSYYIVQFDPERRGGVPGKPSWDFAKLADPSQLSGSDQESQRDLRGMKILTVPQYDLSGVSRSQPWTAVMPRGPQSGEAGLTRELAQMHDFVRCTNQLDLLFTSASIFPFEAVPPAAGQVHPANEGWEFLTITEAAREQELPSWAQVKGGMAGMLMEEFSSGKDDCKLVLLTDHARLSTGVTPAKEEWWEGFAERDGLTIRLKRRAVPGKIMPILQRGFIRTYGLYGQYSLVERRQRAIDRLKDHRFLLRILAEPLCRDSKVFNDDRPLPTKFRSKASVMEDVERMRPLYALQGPPGTGKTTFEAQHLRRFFDAHPEAQVLVTAQAHVAVDVLRRKVREEAFDDQPDAACPLSIRLGRRDDGMADRDSVKSVTRDLLATSRAAMNALTTRTPQQERWLEVLRRTDSARSTKDEDALVRAMQQLLKSGAAITYCTTSASDLAALAESSEFDHNYDLVIVEESGRVHAFDLALPLEAGHRWLLLGDHAQLPPFQIRRFEEALKNLEEAMRALDRLGDLQQIDSKWVERWEKKSPGEKETFQAYAILRLRYFKWLHEHLGGKRGVNATTTGEIKSTGAGMLNVQFRMHPHICGVISRAFYEGLLTTDSDLVEADGNQKRDLRHQLTIPGLPPELDIQNRAVAWIDLPWCGDDPAFWETGQRQEKLNYRNYPEARAVRAFVERLHPTPGFQLEHSIAVLTPYRQQFIALKDELKDLSPPRFLELVSSLGVRNPEERTQWMHTIDSFQGNEADVIVTSLVRNNKATTVRGAIGFMADPERLNVMLSRAKQLLVLVGSWDFFWRHAEHAREGDDAWFLKTTMEMIQGYFADGRAVKIPVTRLTALDPP